MDSPGSRADRSPSRESAAESAAKATTAPPLPPPPSPPGAAFAVALMTGQLPPRPTSEREIILRLGAAELPAQGSLALHDRLV